MGSHTGSRNWIRFGRGGTLAAGLLACMLLPTGCGSPAAPTSSDAFHDSTPATPPGLMALLQPPFDALKDKPHYAAIAVADAISRSDLFPRLFSSGRNQQGVWNDAISQCDALGNGQICGIAARCESPKLNRQHPYVYFARSTVSPKKPFLERGVTGLACGYGSSVKEKERARLDAIAQCRWAGCDKGPHAEVTVDFTR